MLGLRPAPIEYDMMGLTHWPSLHASYFKITSSNQSIFRKNVLNLPMYEEKPVLGLTGNVEEHGQRHTLKGVRLSA